MTLAPKKTILFILFLVAVLPAVSAAPPDDDVVRLTIFHPTARRLGDVLGLLQIGWLKAGRVEILGVYQAKEKIDLPAIEKLIASQPLTRLALRRVDGEVKAEKAFQKNAFTAEIEDIFLGSDGIIFFGGPDLPPAFYGKPTSFLTVIEDPYRHALEVATVFRLLGGSRGKEEKPLLENRPDFPILGICLGGQTLNVGTGGTLVQDIWTETYGLHSVEEALKLPPERWHSNPFLYLYPTEDLFEYTPHPIQFEKNGRLAVALGLRKGDRPYVLSAHHQQIDKLGQGLRAEAYSADGRMVEALSHERFPNVLGLLFHPEEEALRVPEALFRLGPEDGPGQNLRSLLQGHPPSLEFHQKLWSWFGQRLGASARRNRKSR